MVEPSRERLAALDPESFDVSRLQDHFMGKADYYPDEKEDDVEGVEPGLLERWLNRASAGIFDDDFPADAGERMLGNITLLREALQQIGHSSVLLIHRL